jgi:hypothetical protein
MEVLKQIEEEKIGIEEYSDYIKAYKQFLKLLIEKLTEDDYIALMKFNMADPKNIPKPKYENPPVIMMILDDCIGDKDCFHKGNCAISNLTIISELTFSREIRLKF